MLSSLFLKALDLPQKKKKKSSVQRRHTFHGDADKPKRDRNCMSDGEEIKDNKTDNPKFDKTDNGFCLVSLGRRLRKRNGLKDEEAMVSV